MFLPEPRVKIWLCTRPVDMRKSFDGLSALVATHLQDDPLSGQLFVFLNRRKTHVKVLYFDGSGFCIWSKRLEQGQFHHPANGSDKKALDWVHLKLLLDGLEVKKIRQHKRYSHAA